MKRSFIKKVSAKLNTNIFRALIGAHIFVLLCEVVATIMIPEWRHYFYGIIERKAADELVGGLFTFVGVIGAITLAQTIKTLLTGLISVHMRTSLTKVLQKAWMSVCPTRLDDIDNPAQRINEDCRLAAVNFLSIMNEIFISALIVVVLVFQLRNDLEMLFAAAVYTLVVGIAATLFRRPMTNVDIDLQRAEANHRMSLSKIELGVGDFTSKGLFLSVIQQFKRNIWIQAGFRFFGSLQGGLVSLVPFFLLVPQYFEGHITFADVMQGVAVFDLIVVNSTIFINLFPEFVKASASWKRIIQFWKSTK